MDETKDVELLEPGALMRRVLRDAHRLLEDRPASTPQDARGFAQSQRAATMEIFEREGCLVVRLELPALEKEDVSVTVTGDVLAIDDERRCEAEEDRQDAYMPEPTNRKFLRTIALPEGIDAGAVTATFADGVLELTVPLPAMDSPSAFRK
jgi:HSP20 family protein